MNSLKILIVDDDRDTCNLLQTILKMESYQTAIAHSIAGEDIIALLEQEQPDIIMLDYHLTDNDTLSYLNTIRQNPAWRDLAIIMMSAIDRGPECLTAGADKFVQKLSNWKAITEAVNEVRDTVIKR